MNSSPPITSVLVTGANSGLGKECARQMGLRPEVTRVVLACRNREKADAAKSELEAAVQQAGDEDAEHPCATSFEVLILDVTDLDSAKHAVESLSEPVDALVMNAGGMGDREPLKMGPYGVIGVVALNLLGHVALFDGLMAAKKLNKVAILSGTEAARGIEPFGPFDVAPTVLDSGSVEEFTSICDGTFFNSTEGNKEEAAYSTTKYMAALWVSAMARKHPSIRVITVSPGGTAGTEGMRHLPPIKRFLIRQVAIPLFVVAGKVHSLEVGAKRYVDVLTDADTYKSGVFYASDNPGVTGPLGDQSKFSEDFNNEMYQDNANIAIHSFIKE